MSTIKEPPMSAAAERGVDRQWAFQLRREHTALLKEVAVLNKGVVDLQDSDVRVSREVQALLDAQAQLQSLFMEKIDEWERRGAEQEAVMSKLLVEFQALKDDNAALRKLISEGVGQMTNDSALIPSAITENNGTSSALSNQDYTNVQIPHADPYNKKRKHHEPPEAAPSPRNVSRKANEMLEPPANHDVQKSSAGKRPKTATRAATSRFTRAGIPPYMQFGIPFKNYVRSIENGIAMLPGVDQGRLLTSWFKGMDSKVKIDIILQLQERDRDKVVSVGQDMYEFGFHWAEVKEVLEMMDLIQPREDGTMVARPGVLEG
ncbi:MAG: hypothetical protein M1818_001607 [Claussenomyces sp. TS43310]|nr:MAG: hypothetical protein M1818_001607 [Claussenomyces sp. TS43310]